MAAVLPSKFSVVGGNILNTAETTKRREVTDLGI